MGKHGLSVAVARGENAGHVGLHLIVGDDRAFFNMNAKCFKSEVV
jgi:hypothetical protein